MRPNTIWPLSQSIMKLPGMKLLFIFGNVEYKRKKKTENLKAGTIYL